MLVMKLLLNIVILFGAIESLTNEKLEFINEFQESIRSKPDMNSSTKVRIVDYEAPEEQVGKLEEIALGLIKETRFEEALECLTEAERIVRHEIASNHPQHLYIIRFFC